MATNFAYDELSEAIDELIETYQGTHSRVKPSEGSDFVIKLESEANPYSVIDAAILTVEKEVPKFFEENETDLLNLKDEVLGILRKTKYLLTLK